MLEHGGNLYAASQRYAIEPDEWLDLSTGINPESWPVPLSLPTSLWSKLPDSNDDLHHAAQHYYHCDSLLAVAGSQAAIQTLPRLRAHSRVGILTPAYAEHAHAWRQAGHQVIELESTDIDSLLSQLDVVIIINPNNPTGELFSPQQLLAWHNQLARSGGWLIVDEAFIDTTPEHSLAQHCPLPGLIILRSLGKFFGLAGLRVGFVLAMPELLHALADVLGPWPIAQASRYLAQLALVDHNWQAQQRKHLPQQSHRLYALLKKYNLTPTSGCALFQWLCSSHAEQWHHLLAQQGIFTRLFSRPQSLRFGLPKSEADWQRLQHTLEAIIRP